VLQPYKPYNNPSNLIAYIFQLPLYHVDPDSNCGYGLAMAVLWLNEKLINIFLANGADAGTNDTLALKSAILIHCFPIPVLEHLVSSCFW
jgi:hypothetical protein